jgi:hypothetical protein
MEKYKMKKGGGAVGPTGNSFITFAIDRGLTLSNAHCTLLDSGQL